MKTYESHTAEPDPNRLFVGVSQFDVASSGETLVAYGLGACVGIAVYDASAAVGGLAHAMLPECDGADAETDGKFVDTVVELLLRGALEAGAAYETVEGYVVGGATLFDLPDLSDEVSDRNVAVARQELERLGVGVEATATGGTRGRTVELDTGSGELRVVTAHEDEATVLRPGEGADS